MKSNTHKTYSDQFKRDALDLLQSSGKGISQIAKDLGVSANTPMPPMSKENSTCEPTALSAEALYEENQKLHQEISYLRRQRDILKKAASILAEDPQLGLR